VRAIKSNETKPPNEATKALLCALFDEKARRPRCRKLIPVGKFLEDRVRKAEFDADQLESLMVAAFELLGKPEPQAQELARSILRAAEQPQSDDPGSPDQDPPPRRV
jgi:hypothetical protein